MDGGVEIDVADLPDSEPGMYEVLQRVENQIQHMFGVGHPVKGGPIPFDGDSALLDSLEQTVHGRACTGELGEETAVDLDPQAGDGADIGGHLGGRLVARSNLHALRLKDLPGGVVIGLGDVDILVRGGAKVHFRVENAQ